MIKKCLFPAAGYGTRFLPATKAVPKEMLPIINKPLLQYGVEEALSAGITNMAIVTGRGKRAIEDHFDNAFELEAQLSGTQNEHYLKDINRVINLSTFSYIRQKEMLGLGDAILTGEPLIGKESFAVVLADDLCISEGDSVIKQMINIFSQHKCSIVAIQEVPMNQTKKYGIVEGKLLKNSSNIYQVHSMVEKPDSKKAPSKMAIIGRYILTPDIFPVLNQMKPTLNGELQLTDALNILAKKGKVIAYKFRGKRFDCGGTEGFLEANNYLSKFI
jgi:UTP--glucose-1-phosphate uridylyltransferase